MFMGSRPLRRLKGWGRDTYSGLDVTKLIIIKRYVIRIEACILFLVVRDIVTKNFD